MKTALLLSLIMALSAEAADWPQFRGPTGNGVTTERDLPLQWNGKTGEGIAWRAALPKSDHGWSSPIVTADRVIVTCVQNEPVAHQVLCFDARSGKPLWKTDIEPGPWVLKDLRGGYGAPTPCSDGKRLFVLFGSAVFAALDLDGKLLWRRELEHFAFDVALGTSPLLFGSTVILDGDQTGKGSSLIGFDQATGEIRWEAKRPDANFTHCTPVLGKVNGHAQLFIAASRALQGVDPENGEVLWSCPAPGDAASPAYDGELIYSDSGRGGKGVCVKPPEGKAAAPVSPLWVYAQIPEGLSSPVIAGGLVWRAHNSDTLKAIRLKDGSLAFSERVPGIATYASPFATADQRVYFASAGKTVVVAAEEPFRVLATSDLGEDNRATAAVANGHIYLRSESTLFCIGPP